MMPFSLVVENEQSQFRKDPTDPTVSATGLVNWTWSMTMTMTMSMTMTKP